MALIQENPLCSYYPRAQTTFLRSNFSGSALHETSAWAAGQTVPTPPPEEFGHPGGKGAASTQRRDEPPQLLLCSRCAGCHGTGTASPCTKAQLHAAGTLLLQRAGCAQQASSISEFQQPRSFPSLCKSLLSLDWQNTYLVQKPALISTNPALSSLTHWWNITFFIPTW